MNIIEMQRLCKMWFPDYYGSINASSSEQPRSVRLSFRESGLLDLAATSGLGIFKVLGQGTRIRVNSIVNMHEASRHQHERQGSLPEEKQEEDWPL